MLFAIGQPYLATEINNTSRLVVIAQEKTGIFLRDYVHVIVLIATKETFQFSRGQVQWKFSPGTKWKLESELRKNPKDSSGTNQTKLS
jgi:hypothetical protein